MRHTGLLLALIVFSLVTLAGCGGASEEDFESDVVAARNRTDAALTQVTRAKSVDDLLERLRVAATEIRAAATDVQEADAPEELGDEEKGLEMALRALSDELVATVNSFLQAPEAMAMARGFDFEAWNTVQRRLADLRRAGIDVPALERIQAP